jgi:phosphatidylinositol glycan class U
VRSGREYVLISDLRHPLFTLTVYLYTLILLPLLHSLWLLTGTGNANFFYAATMVHGLNSSLAIVDVVGSAIRSHTKSAVARAEGSRNDGAFWKDRHVVQLNKVD